MREKGLLTSRDGGFLSRKIKEGKGGLVKKGK